MAGKLLQRYCKISSLTVDAFYFGKCQDLNINMPADLDQFR